MNNGGGMPHMRYTAAVNMAHDGGKRAKFAGKYPSEANSGSCCVRIPVDQGFTGLEQGAVNIQLDGDETRATTRVKVNGSVEVDGGKVRPYYKQSRSRSSRSR